MKHLIFFILFCFCLKGFSQTDSLKGELVKYYYGNGQVSSEGIMVDGKPDGYWKTFYVNGIIKSEGNRRNFQLDSIWNFYDEDGDIDKKISYLYGKKNGYYYTYAYQKNDSGIKTGGLESKELYVDDQKQGLSFYYYSDGKLFKTINYKNGLKEDVSKEYSEDSMLISIVSYHNDYIISREYINRTDSRGNKQGVWKQFYPNDKVKVEENYQNGKLHGYYREYDSNGKVIKLVKYMNGVEVQEEVEEKSDSLQVDIRSEYWPDGKIKKTGAYRENKPVGIHKYFDDQGTEQLSYEYDDFGNKIGEGITDPKNLKQGRWKEYYSTGELKAEGDYKSNKRTGEWKFYFKSGKLEQKGSYKKGKPNDAWIWYFENGAVEREESFLNGKEEGPLTEYDEAGKIITKGNYIEGLEDGEWFYHVGDHTEEGIYRNGQPDGEWKHYYENGKLRFEGSYIQGNAEGKHRYYYDNGKVKEEGSYIVGKKEGNWKRYDREGNLIMVILYENGEEKKIDGIKMKTDDDTKTEDK